jgi:hypothetical protein
MTELVIWAFVAIVQMNGMTGGAGGTQEQCEEQRQEIMKIHDVVFISPCAQITLTKPSG